jgi:putative salt-induced outer membrane protein YdiY
MNTTDLQVKVRQVLIAASILLSGICPQSSFADQIILKNGDRITGSIIKKDDKKDDKKDGSTLTIKSDLFGVITAPWDKVESVKSDTILNVATADGKALRGTISSNNGAIEVMSGTTKSVFPAAEIGAIRNADEQKLHERMLKPGWGDLWAGSATVGWAGSKGNAQTLTFTTGMNAQRVTKTDKTVVYFNSIKASAFSSGKNSSTAQAVRGGIGYDHNIHPKVFLTTFNDYEYDRFQNLDLRFVIGGGLGYQLYKKENSSLSIVGGGAFNHSTYSTPATTQTAEGYFGDDYTRKLGKASSFIQTARMFNDLKHPGNYRINFDAGTSVRLTRWLNWNISLSDRYVTPPALGRKSNDILYTTGLGFTFAR